MIFSAIFKHWVLCSPFEIPNCGLVCTTCFYFCTSYNYWIHFRLCCECLAGMIKASTAKGNAKALSLIWSLSRKHNQTNKNLIFLATVTSSVVFSVFPRSSTCSPLFPCWPQTPSGVSATFMLITLWSLKSFVSGASWFHGKFSGICLRGYLTVASNTTYHRLEVSSTLFNSALFFWRLTWINNCPTQELYKPGIWVASLTPALPWSLRS